MLIEVKMRCKFHDKEKDEEVMKYVPSLINTDNINSAIPSGIDGVLQVAMVGMQGHTLVKAKLADLQRLENGLKLVKGKK
jgi:hypothetical protein